MDPARDLADYEPLARLKLNRIKEVKRMPGFDKTGPLGDGPMSGRAQGMCRSSRSGRQTERSGGYGLGRGRRQGRGFKCGMGNRFGRQGIGPNRTQPFNDEDNE